MTQENDVVAVRISPEMTSGKVLLQFDTPTQAVLISSDQALEIAQVLVAAAVFCRHVNEAEEACECATTH